MWPILYTNLSYFDSLYWWLVIICLTVYFSYISLGKTKPLNIDHLFQVPYLKFLDSDFFFSRIFNRHRSMINSRGTLRNNHKGRRPTGNFEYLMCTHSSLQSTFFKNLVSTASFPASLNSLPVFLSWYLGHATLREVTDQTRAPHTSSVS